MRELIHIPSSIEIHLAGEMFLLGLLTEDEREIFYSHAPDSTDRDALEPVVTWLLHKSIARQALNEVGDDPAGYDRIQILTRQMDYQMLCMASFHCFAFHERKDTEMIAPDPAKVH